MPEDTQAYNWNSNNMPWTQKSNTNSENVKLFNGSTSEVNLNRLHRIKRKTDECSYL